MEDFYSDKLTALEGKSIQMLAVQNEATAVRENFAKVIISMATEPTPKIIEQLRKFDTIVGESQIQFNALAAFESLDPKVKVECNGTDDDERSPTGDNAVKPTEECDDPESEEGSILELHGVQLN